MSSNSAEGAKTSNKTIIAAILVVIAVVAVIVGIIYFVEPAKDLPGFMGHIALTAKHRHRANSTRPLHGAAAIVVAVVCGAGAWFTLKKGKPAGTASATPAADKAPSDAAKS